MIDMKTLSRKIERDAIAAKIDDIYQAAYRNICDLYGGEDKIPPFDLANIRGSLTRAKTYALQPLETLYGQETIIEPDCPVLSVGFRV